MSTGLPASLPPAVEQVSGQRRIALGDVAQMCVGETGQTWSVRQADESCAWLDTSAPTTAAATLASHGLWEAGAATDFDARDYWFRMQLPASRGARSLLCLDGLATHADVFLDGEPLLESRSMFARHVLDVGVELSQASTLHIRCAALAPAYAERRPRPRWPSPLASQRNLRHLRTTLLGRMPGLFPAPAPVGPFRPMWLVEQDELAVDALRLIPRCREGAGGEVELRAGVRSLTGAPVREATLRVGDAETAVRCRPTPEGGSELRATLILPEVERWWPHTHGAQPRYEASLVVRHGDCETHVSCTQLAFRSLVLEARPPDFGYEVNGVPLFARGACWMPLDPVRMWSDPGALRAALAQARDAGMNMLRVPGFTLYETPEFHALCDELGMLVWQDLMFANFDYPAEDPGFVARARGEVAQVLEALADRPSSALLCGNSEAEQQAAMMGLAPEESAQPLFEQSFAEQVGAHGGVAYQPSTPHGGVRPFRTAEGTTHYYGVGAYERGFDDLRSAGVRFAPECLAFSHVPEYAAPGPGEPLHRTGVPRDPGASWDFADTTEHYVERLYGVEARSLRRGDPERHLELTRRAPAEAIALAQGVWRRGVDPCRGALLFTLRDLRAGAGWGVVAQDGSPKAAYWALRRAWAPRALWFVDEGLDGVRLWAANDLPEAWQASLHLRLLRADGRELLQAQRTWTVPARGTASVDVEESLGHFVDASRAYRFGQREHDLIWARLGEEPHGPQAFFFPPPAPLPTQLELGLRAEATPRDGGGFDVTITSERVAQSVRVLAPRCRPSDNYFDVAPGAERRLHLAPAGGASTGTLRARLWPLNARSPIPVELAGR